MSQIDNLSREFIARPRPLDPGLSPYQRGLIRKSIAQLSDDGGASRYETFISRLAFTCDILASSLGGLIIFALLLYMTLGWVLEDPLTGIQAFRKATQPVKHSFSLVQP